MTIEKARYWAENMTELSKNDRLWLNNPVIMQGVGLAPMVVAAFGGAEEGVKCYINRLACEFEDTMRMCGAPDVAHITRSMVRYSPLR